MRTIVDPRVLDNHPWMGILGEAEVRWKMPIRSATTFGKITGECLCPA